MVERADRRHVGAITKLQVGAPASKHVQALHRSNLGKNITIASLHRVRARWRSYPGGNMQQGSLAALEREVHVRPCFRQQLRQALAVVLHNARDQALVQLRAQCVKNQCGIE